MLGRTEVRLGRLLNIELSGGRVLDTDTIWA
jgi:hypothetical protein